MMMADIYDQSLIEALWGVCRLDVIYGDIYGENLWKCYAQ